MQQLTGPFALFSSSWNTFKTYWKPLVTITLAPSLVMYAGQNLSSVGGVLYGLVGGVLMLVGALVSIALQPALITAVNKLATDPAAGISFKEQYKIGFRYFWPVLGLAILHGVIVIGSTLFFVISGIAVGIYTCMYIFSYILDGKKGLSSFTEVYALIKGRWWGTFGRLVFLAVPYVLSSFVIIGLVFIITKIAGSDLNSSGVQPVSSILSLLLNGVMMPLGVIYLYNLYINLKATRLPDVSTAGFRKWLIFFLIVGIVALIVLPLLGFGLATFMSPQPHL